MAAKFVIPYRQNEKNDANDAEVICEAVSRPKTRFISIKSEEQQAVLCLHRIRQGLIETRTATISQLRGLLSEFGLVMPQGRYSVQNSINVIQIHVHTTCYRKFLLTDLHWLNALRVGISHLKTEKMLLSIYPSLSSFGFDSNGRFNRCICDAHNIHNDIDIL